MPRTREYILLYAAAYHFARFSRKSAEIAESVVVSDNTVRRFSKDLEWNRALDILSYTGIREFEREARRDTTRERGKYTTQHARYTHNF